LYRRRPGPGGACSEKREPFASRSRSQSLGLPLGADSAMTDGVLRTGALPPRSMRPNAPFASLLVPAA
jgi:hypothetical protein